uniref:(northern house mosquito) hypothetical protein n=1 Tax=Culex pipiens TaxID=7175 RepID=A0A8D8JW35_CULPI
MHNCATVQLRFSATFWRFFRTFSRIFRALFVRFSRPTRTKNVPAHFCTVHFALLFASRPTLRALNCPFREVSRTWPDRILRIRFEGPNVRACGRFGRFRTLIINRLALIKTIYCANRNYTIYS